MNQPVAEPSMSPVARLSIAAFFLCCAALAISYAWTHFEENEAKKARMEAEASRSAPAESAPPAQP